MNIKALFLVCFMFILAVISYTKTNINAQKITNNEKAADKFASRNKPIITPSNVTEKLESIKQSNPKTSSRELAKYGNDLINKTGFDFSFYTCEIAEVNKEKGERYDGENLIPFDYPFEDLSGKNRTYQIMSKDNAHPCDCVYKIPLTKAAKNELTIIDDGKPISVKHLEKYNIEYAELVTKDLKKFVRRWYKPFEIQPFGISKDGTKIYVETSYNDDDLLNKEGLLLEISEKGTFQFVLKNNPNIISKQKLIENYPKDETNDYFGYLKFTDGKIEHILKITFPCT